MSQCIDEKEKELQSMFSEKERELLETQQMVAGKLGQTEQRAALTQQKFESLQNELLEIRAKYEEERQAKSEELDMLESDLERATHRAESAEKEADQLRSAFKMTRFPIRLKIDLVLYFLKISEIFIISFLSGLQWGVNFRV